MSTSSESDSKSKDKKKVDKKSKKAKKKAKKESKKAKKLAKQIKKLEDEVARRKRQMNGEVQEKKKKKKKDSSSSSSTQSAKKLKKGAREGEDPNLEAGHEDQDQQTGKVARPCPQCSEEMLWSDLAEGDYSEDWWCDNIQECGSSGSKSRTRWRWNCQKCTRDLCRECKGLPEGWIESVEEAQEPAQLSESSSEESNPERHEGAECDHCEMCPIIGPRFKCTTCEDVSLCRTCYKRRLEVHKPGHRFFAMKPLGVPSDATEKLKERKKLEKEKQEEMEKQKEKEMRDKRLQQTQGMQGHAQPYESRYMMGAMGAMGDNEQHQPEVHSNATGFHMAPSFLPIHFAPPVHPIPIHFAPPPVQPIPIHFAPPVQPTDAPEVASKLQERWQNIGQEYKKSWQGPQETAAEPKKTKEQKVKDAKVEPATRVGKQLLRGSKCGLCLQQVLDSASGVVCSRKRPDGSDGGCGKGVCFPCMLRASSMMFGKVRITKEIWVTLSDKAWWMHERCMTENDYSDFEDLIQSFGLKTKLDEASAELPQGWTRKISHTTGKVFFVNAKLGQAQWDLPTRDVEASPNAGDKSKEDRDHGVANGNQKVEDMDVGGNEQAGDQEELVEL